MEYLNTIRNDNSTAKIHNQGENDPDDLYWLNLFFSQVFSTLLQLC